MKSTYFTALSLTLSIFASVSAADDLATVIEDCNGCHGNDGVSQWSDVPTIAGVPEFVQADALYIFRDNERPCSEKEYKQGDTSRPATTMCEAVADLSDDMIDDLAAYYFELPYVAAQQEFDADLAKAGQALHERLCDMCHSEGGSNADDEAGLLAGQQIGYLKTTFAEYASGDRSQSKKMDENIANLSDADVTALLNFYVSQQ